MLLEANSSTTIRFVISFLSHLCPQELVIRVDKVMRNRGEQRDMRVHEARPIIEDMESERLTSSDTVRGLVVPLKPDVVLS